MLYKIIVKRDVNPSKLIDRLLYRAEAGGGAKQNEQYLMLSMQYIEKYYYYYYYCVCKE